MSVNGRSDLCIELLDCNERLQNENRSLLQTISGLVDRLEAEGRLDGEGRFNNGTLGRDRLGQQGAMANMSWENEELRRQTESLVHELSVASASAEKFKRRYEQVQRQLSEEKRECASLSSSLQQAQFAFESAKRSHSEFRVGASQKIDELLQSRDGHSQELMGLKQKLAQAYALVEDSERRRLLVEQQLDEEKENSKTLRSLLGDVQATPTSAQRVCSELRTEKSHETKELAREIERETSENASLSRGLEESKRGPSHSNQFDQTANSVQPMPTSDGIDDLQVQHNVEVLLGGGDDAPNENVKMLKQELSDANLALKELEYRHGQVQVLLEEEKRTSRTLRKSLDNVQYALTVTERSYSEMRLDRDNLARNNDGLRHKLQTTRDRLVVVERERDALASQFARQFTHLQTKMRPKDVPSETSMGNRSTGVRSSRENGNTDEDVILTTRKLNSRIFDIANVVSQGFTFQAGNKPDVSLDDREMEGVVEAIGAKLLHYVKNNNHDSDSIVVHTAIQTALVRLVVLFLVACSVSDVPEDEHRSENTLNHSQPSRQQSLTYNASYMHIDDVPSMLNRAVDLIARILLISGVPVDRVETECMVNKLARNDLDNLFQMVTCLSSDVKDLDSTDYQLFYVQPSALYDDKTMCKYETVKSHRARPLSNDAERVLCSVELGLKRVLSGVGPDMLCVTEEIIVDKAIVVSETEAEVLWL